MKIMLITHCAGNGGANVCLLNLLDGLTANNIKVVVVMPMQGTFTRELEKRNIKYYILSFPMWVIPNDYTKMHKKVSKLRYQFQKYCASINLAAICKREGIQVIHTNSSITELGQVVADKLGMRHIWHIREFFDFFDWEYIMEKSYVKKQYSNAYRVVAVSLCVKSKYEEDFKLGNIVKIYDGINKFHGKSKKYEDFTIIYSGGSQPNKGAEEVLEAARLLKIEGFTPNIIMADTEGNKIIKSFIQKHKLDNVYQIGFLKNIRELRSKCHISLNCSKGETFGLVTAESMGEKTLVIASNTGANTELLTDGLEGIIYEYHNVTDLKNKIIHVIENYPDYLPMIERAYCKCNNDFGSESYARNVMNLYYDECERKLV